jgi:hypothetical protein
MTTQNQIYLCILVFFLFDYLCFCDSKGTKGRWGKEKHKKGKGNQTFNFILLWQGTDSKGVYLCESKETWIKIHINVGWVTAFED